MQPLYWLCEPPRDEGCLIWPVRLHGNTENRDVTGSRFLPKTHLLESLVVPKIKQAFGPLFFTKSLEKAKGNVIGNGSFTLVCTNTKLLLVTCHHVWNDFLKERKENPSLKLCACFDDKYPVCICSKSDGTENEPIAQNKELDIAVFDMEPFREFVGENKNFFFPSFGVQSHANVNDLVGIIGSPGIQREETDEGIYFGRQPYFAYVAAAYNFTIRVDFTRVMSFNRELTITPADERPATRGVSGGPCFVIRQDYQPYLIGIVTDHTVSKHTEYNYAIVTTSNCINEDGTLKDPDSFRNNTNEKLTTQS